MPAWMCRAYTRADLRQQSRPDGAHRRIISLTIMIASGSPGSIRGPIIGSTVWHDAPEPRPYAFPEML
jgi:hypothetical protein